MKKEDAPGVKRAGILLNWAGREFFVTFWTVNFYRQRSVLIMPPLSTFQHFAGRPLNIKEAGRSKQLLELRAYSQIRCYIQPTPGRVTQKSNKKRHGYGRVTASRYFEYLLKLNH